MDIRALIDRIRRDGYFALIALNLLAQFGTPRRQYLGATLLPERLVPQNAYRETGVKYRTIIANDGTRYSPVQKKGGDFVGDFLVELGESDIGREISSREYDTLIELLNRNASMDATARLIGWADTVLNRALIEHNERQRWQAIVAAQVTRRGDGGYEELVPYSNPAGHRTNAAGLWSSDAYDPYDGDIRPKVDLLASKGYTVNRIIIPRTVLSLLSANDKIQARTGSIVANVGGSISVVRASASMDAIAEMFRRDGLPAPELYDLQFRTSAGTDFFLPRNCMVFVATTGQDERIDLGDNARMVTDVVGYSAIGRAAGQPAPGRKLLATAFENKPPRVEGEGWQTSLPVITEPEAIGVISAIA